MKSELVMPSGVTAVVEKTSVIVSGKEGKVTKEFKSKLVSAKQEGDKIIFSSIDDRKKSLAVLNTCVSIVQNMFDGVQKKYTYTLRGVYSHFPLSISVKGKLVQVGNFTGEKNPRETKILDNVEVTIKGKDIIVTSCDKEAAGIVAGNIEASARVVNRDRRVFQDGVYLISKAVRE